MNLRVLGKGLLCKVAGAFLLLAGCTSPAEEVAFARDEYQAAFDRGDYPAARVAMLRAVSVNDGSAELWTGLGRVQLALREYNGAFYAYSRAAELDRTNAEALQALADISLLGGRLREAERYVEQLELLRPGDPGPLTTKGYIHLRRGKPAEASKTADAVLALRPMDINATILKARALEAQAAPAEGARLLEAQVAARGPSEPVLQSLLALYTKSGDAPGTLRTKARLLNLAPADPDRMYDYARELYRAGDRDQARPISVRLAASRPGPKRIAEITSLWLAHDSKEEALRNARDLAAGADPAEQVQYANFFVDAGRPDEGEALLRSRAVLPVEAGNVDAVAALARSRAAARDADGALRLADAVLEFDPSNDAALRVRADFFLSNGRYDAALADARRLTAENPSSAEDRVRLAKAYALKGNGSLAESTYWRAFRDIPGNALIYDSLKALLIRSKRQSEVAVLEQRYEEQNRNLRNRVG